MIILDTNVVSAVMEPASDEVVEWLDRQPQASLWITAINVYEMEFGLECLPAGRRRQVLTNAFHTFIEDIDHRIVALDGAAATHAAQLSAVRRRKGRPVELRDTMIAGIVLARRATLATRNTKHFTDLNVPVVNPWKD